MRRRTFLALSGLAAASPSRAVALEPARIAFPVAGQRDSAASIGDLAWLREGLAKAGLTERTDYILDTVYAEGDYGRFPALISELLGRRPAAILVTTIASARAARSLTTSVPVVMMGLNDPIGVGLVDNLARPGGNLTGVATMNEDLQTKLLQLVRELMPAARTVAFLRNPANPSNTGMLTRLTAEAASLGIESLPVDLETPSALDEAFAGIARAKPDALFVIPDFGLVALGRPIVERATGLRLPVIGPYPVVQAGGILSYESSRAETVRLAAGYLQRIVAGAKPADLPVVQPTILTLAINLKAARALGIAIPDSFLARADEVIE